MDDTVSQLKDITTTVNSVLTSLGIIVGGTWAYYKFIRHRALSPHLNFSFEYSSWTLRDLYTLYILRTQAINVGSTKLPLPDGDKHLRISFSEPNASNKPTSLQYISFAEPILKKEIFGNHSWIEPGENISDTLSFLTPPDIESPAFMVDVIIYYEDRIKWRTQWIVPAQTKKENKLNDK